MNKLLKVLRMEFRMTAANKTFVIITIIGPFLLLAVTFLPTLVTRSTVGVSEGTVVGILGGDAALLDRLDAALDQAPIVLRKGASESEFRQAVLESEMKGFLMIPEDYLEAGAIPFFSATGTDFVLRDMLRGYLGSAIVAIRMDREGLDPERVAYLSARPYVDIQTLKSGGDSERQDEMSIFMTAIAFTLLLYMTILLHGQSAARSVLKEKTSKTVEILLSSLRPTEMLFGKVLGQAAAGLLQYGIWVSVAALLIKVVGPAAKVSLPLSLNAGTLVYLVVFFILAFFLYSSAYAAIGSAAEDESHLGQLSWPIIVFLVLPMVMSSAILMNPSSGVVVFFSLFPLTAPITMFVRILVGVPAAWEIALCIGILLVTIAGTTIASAKIFRVGILMTGKRFKIGEIVRWIRY